MLTRRPTYSPLATSALREIQAAGVKVTPEHVVWLHETVQQYTRSANRPAAELVDWPEPCGGALLYPLTYGALEWCGRLPDDLADDDRVVGWASAHSRDCEAFEGMTGRGEIVRVARRWARRLTCSPSALSAALDRVIPERSLIRTPDVIPLAPGRTSSGYGAALAALCSRFPGTDPDYWMWGVSLRFIGACLEQVSAEVAEHGKATAADIELVAAVKSVTAQIIAEGKANG